MIEKRKVKHIIIVFTLVLVIISSLVSFVGCNTAPLIFDNPMLFAELKPESYNILVNSSGEVIGYELKSDEDMPSRTVNFDTNGSEDELKALAYQLYEIGNKTMVTVHYASYYEEGTNNSTLTIMGGETELPLIFRTIDMRNNLTGEHFRQTLQFVKEGTELGLIDGIMGGMSESGQRWYVKAGCLTNDYFKTTKFVNAEGGRDCDWSKATVENSINGYEEKRKSISVNPIPYTSSGFQGKINGQSQTEKNLNGMQWIYDAESGYSIPYYIDGGGRLIGYEKTDQHVFFSMGNDANKYDSEGNLIEEDYYNTIKSATVEYNAEGGYYTVKMVIDSEKEYTHIDTNWALKDNKGADDADARFTGLEIEFQLWDNGYFKQWEMWERWESPNAHNMARMVADQYYKAVFSYNSFSADFTRYYTPVQPR